MKLSEIADRLSLKVAAAGGSLGREITNGYASDLLSDVIANAKEGDVWITLQTHPNIVAVATMKNLSGIIVVNSRVPEKDTIEKAEQENIPVMVSSLPTFDLVGELHELGIGRKRQC